MNAKTHILYIDSNENYSKKLLNLLIMQGHNLKYCKDIKEAYIEFSKQTPDLIIIDSLLEENNGSNFIHMAKSYEANIKIILLTSKNNQNMLRQALELKIDKFIPKSNKSDDIVPVVKELNLVINQIEKDHKKTKQESDSTYDLGNNFIYDACELKIINGKNTIDLTYQETELLNLLIKANNEFVSTEQLKNSIGKYGETTIETIRTVIRKIRKKTYNEIIINKSKIGYRVNLHKDIIQNNESNIFDIKIQSSILVIKGNKTQSDMLSYQLSKLGFLCESVYTLEDAKEALNNQQFDYIVISLNLPDGDSIDFIRDFRNINNAKFIIISDKTDLHYKEYLYFKGILDFIINTDDMEYLVYSIYNTIYKVHTNTQHNNILIIDKSKKVCEQIKDLLIPRNYNINALNEMSQALDLVKHSTFNLIIIDINFESAFEFMYKVKKEIDYTLPFIFLTDTNRTYETVRDTFKNGASECLRKPIFAEEFILKIDQIMDQSKLIYELRDQKKFLKSYQLIVDKTTIVSKTDLNGIITYANDMFCQISGYEKDELIGSPHNIVRDPSIPKNVFKELWYTIKEEKKIWSGIITNRKKDGTQYKVQSYVMPILDQNHNIIEFIALRNIIINN